MEGAFEKIYGDPSPSPLDLAAAIHLTEPQIPEEKNETNRRARAPAATEFYFNPERFALE